jgi:hypothetical protein
MTMQGDTAWNEVQLLTYLRSALFLVNKLKEILPEDWNDKGRPWQLIREYICARIRSTSYSIMSMSYPHSIREYSRCGADVGR